MNSVPLSSKGARHLARSLVGTTNMAVLDYIKCVAPKQFLHNPAILGFDKVALASFVNQLRGHM